jgi:hypothetical protein
MFFLNFPLSDLSPQKPDQLGQTPGHEAYDQNWIGK